MLGCGLSVLTTSALCREIFSSKTLGRMTRPTVAASDLFRLSSSCRKVATNDFTCNALDHTVVVLPFQSSGHRQGIRDLFPSSDFAIPDLHIDTEVPSLLSSVIHIFYPDMSESRKKPSVSIARHPSRTLK